MVLQLLGLALIAWAALTRTDERLPRGARQLLWIAALALALVTVQLLPLPPTLWTHLGGRGVVAEGYDILKLRDPWVPLSLTPYRSLDALFGLIPPLALFCAMTRAGAYRPSWMVAALVCGTVAGVLLGALQVTSGELDSSPWYLYPEASFGVAAGFFANGNHMATLLLATLPFLAALFASPHGRNIGRNRAVQAIAAALALLIFVGLILNKSLAGYALAPPVVAAGALILLNPRSRWRRLVLIVSAALLLGSIAVLATSSVRNGQFASDAPTAVESREEMLSTTAKALRDFLPWGSGLGSFRSVYQLYENPAEVGDVYVIHAHNDYVELALETGVPGILLIVAFLAWWARAAFRSWRYPDGGPYARAASIASAAILAHSVVDFPLRTAAIQAVFAMCLALLLERVPAPVRSTSDLRPTRHIIIR
jgi:O-antigen ligase